MVFMLCLFVGDAATNNLHLQNLQSLAALAGAANGPGIFTL